MHISEDKTNAAVDLVDVLDTLSLQPGFLVIYANRLASLWPQQTLETVDIADILLEKDAQLLLIGTGQQFMTCDKLRMQSAAQGIGIETMNNDAALRTHIVATSQGTVTTTLLWISNSN